MSNLSAPLTTPLALFLNGTLSDSPYGAGIFPDEQWGLLEEGHLPYKGGGRGELTETEAVAMRE